MASKHGKRYSPKFKFQVVLEALESAGLQSQDEPRRRLVVDKPLVIRQDEAMIAAMPCDEPEMQIIYDLDYSRVNRVIGRQLRTFDFTNGDYAHEIAPSRTFALEQEAAAARAQGLFQHLTPDEALVIGESGPLGNNVFRFDDEPVRHKIVDLIGDLYLLGAPIQGRIIAYFTDKGFGFIQTDEERKFFFHIANVVDDDLRGELPSYVPGETIDVAFQYGGHDGKKYPKAINVALSSEER